MGAVAGLPSAGKERRKRVIEQLAQDLDPASREAVMRVYENWNGEESEQELDRLLGRRVARKFKAAAVTRRRPRPT